MDYILQTRWKLEDKYLIYYGLRKAPYTFKRKIYIGKKRAKIIENLDKNPVINKKEFNLIKNLIDKDIIVESNKRKNIPTNFDEANFCKQCCANDYIIPGLELNEDGLCPMCFYEKKLKKYHNVLPLIKDIKPSKSSKYDVALFLTGGKDSSYLLYYLAKVKNLRVLALTWKIPFMSENSVKSIENAKKKLDNVDFVVKEVPKNSLDKIYKKLYSLQNNTCMCPSMAYILFYPLLSKEKVPYLILGNEPAQCKNLIYNNMSPKFAFIPKIQSSFNHLHNLLRILTVRKPYKTGQFEMKSTLKGLAEGSNKFVKLFNFNTEIIDNVHQSLWEAPEIMKSFEYEINKEKTFYPRLIHIDLSDISEGKIYNWNNIKKLLQKEIGWVDVPQNSKALHTSCTIEKVKEFTQLKKFRDMESQIIPFSAIELSLAVGQGCISREKAITELKKSSGLSTKKPCETELLSNYKNQSEIKSA